jgi:hypothetical protein
VAACVFRHAGGRAYDAKDTKGTKHAKNTSLKGHGGTETAEEATRGWRSQPWVVERRGARERSSISPLRSRAPLLSTTKRALRPARVAAAAAVHFDNRIRHDRREHHQARDK